MPSVFREIGSVNLSLLYFFVLLLCACKDTALTGPGESSLRHKPPTNSSFITQRATESDTISSYIQLIPDDPSNFTLNRKRKILLNLPHKHACFRIPIEQYRFAHLPCLLRHVQHHSLVLRCVLVDILHIHAAFLYDHGDSHSHNSFLFLWDLWVRLVDGSHRLFKDLKMARMDKLSDLTSFLLLKNSSCFVLSLNDLMQQQIFRSFCKLTSACSRAILRSGKARQIIVLTSGDKDIVDWIWRIKTQTDVKSQTVICAICVLTSIPCCRHECNPFVSKSGQLSTKNNLTSDPKGAQDLAGNSDPNRHLNSKGIRGSKRLSDLKKSLPSQEWLDPKRMLLSIRLLNQNTSLVHNGPSDSNEQLLSKKLKRTGQIGSDNKAQLKRQLNTTGFIRIGQIQGIKHLGKPINIVRQRSKRLAVSHSDSIPRKEDNEDVDDDMLRQAFEDIETLERGRKMDRQLIEKLYEPPQGEEYPKDMPHSFYNEPYKQQKLYDKVRHKTSGTLDKHILHEDFWGVPKGSPPFGNSYFREKKSKLRKITVPQKTVFPKKQLLRSEKKYGYVQGHDKDFEQKLLDLSKNVAPDSEKQTLHSRRTSSMIGHKRKIKYGRMYGPDRHKVNLLRHYTASTLLPITRPLTNTTARKAQSGFARIITEKVSGSTSDVRRRRPSPRPIKSLRRAEMKTTPMSSNIDTKAIERMVDSVRESDRKEMNVTYFADLVDEAKDRIDLNMTEIESWKILLHGRRDVIIAGAVMVMIGLLITGMAIGGALVRYSSMKRGFDTNNSKSYRIFGSKEERAKLKHLSLFREDSDEEDELFVLPEH